jgi:hypothetical protein
MFYYRAPASYVEVRPVGSISIALNGWNDWNHWNGSPLVACYGNSSNVS